MATWPAYLTVADADLYHASHGSPTAWTGATTSSKELALRSATEWLDQTYGTRWIGYRSVSTQVRDWPRNGVYDRDGRAFSSTEVPQVVKDACSYMALRYLENGELKPDLTYAGEVKLERSKVGPLETEIEYMGGKSQDRIYRIVEDMLVGRGVIASGTEVFRA
jgi:hypothetical protein